MTGNLGRRGAPATIVILMLSFASNQCDRAAEIPEVLLLAGGPSRPSVVRSNPAVETPVLAVGGAIFVEFDRDMHEEKTANAFALSGRDSPAGRTVWSANRLTYEPDRALAIGGTYLLRVLAGATSKEGVALGREFLIHFVHGGAAGGGPRVVETTPLDNAQSAAQGTSIQVRFDRSMDVAATQKAFRITPSVDGSFAWAAGTTLLTFQPLLPLESGRSYSVTLASTAADAGGVLLSSPYSFSFRAGIDFNEPSVLSVTEVGVPVELTDGNAGIGKDSSFLIEFSEPMQPTATNASLSLTRVDNSGLAAHTLSWNPGFTRVTLTPDQPLEPEHAYRFEVSTGARDTSSNSLAAPVRRTFRVDASAGLLRSDYLALSSVQKDLPAPVSPVAVDPTAFSVLQLPAAGGALGDALRLRLRFSLPLARGSVPTNVSLRRLVGTGSAGSLTGVAFAPLAGQNDRELVLDFDGIGNNDYELRLTGGRTGIRSTTASGESGSFLAENVVLYLRIVP